MTLCENCGAELPTPGKRGPGRRFCSDRCRKAAGRRPSVVALPMPARNGDEDDYVKALCRQRDLLWDLLDQASPGAASGLSRELRQVQAELERVYAARVAGRAPSKADELIERRRLRRQQFGGPA